MKTSRASRASIASLAAFVMAGTASTHASVVMYETPDGATVGGHPVDVQATFSTGPGTVSITVENILVDPASVIQNLSRLTFTLDTGETNGTIGSSSGLERTVNNNHTFTDGMILPTGWELDVAPLSLHVLGTVIGPAHTILGSDGGNGIYDGAGGSIAGNNAHNPFLTGVVTFVVNVPGVTMDSSVNNAIFGFGTSEGNNIPGRRVPEPTTLAMIASAGMALLRRRRWALTA